MGAKATSGYSGTPLAKKLGIKEGSAIRLVQPPETYFSYFQYFPEEIRFVENNKEKVHFIHYFPKNVDTLQVELPALREQLVQDGMIWISWPKKSAQKQTDLSGNTVRQIGLRYGLVDVKVCSVNEIWSALKFVIPVKDRVKHS
ncbi:DUF3052 domain-containing protein [Muriicola sp.]|uniref:DUF3052 domain-containing protein n=1 Tax=Muriicola sp. TaxID=2020856 RepID=UPI003C791136